MNFGFSEEQELLRREVRKFLDDRCPRSEVRKHAGLELAADLWREVSGLGWPGLTVPEQYGGAGLGWIDLVVLLEETGRTLFPSPLVSTTLAEAALLQLGDEAQRARWLPRLASGEAIGTLALLEQNDVLGPAGVGLIGKPDGGGYRLSGTKCFVHDAGSATLFVVAFRTGAGADDLALGLVERGARGVSARAFPAMDATKPMGDLVLDDVQVSADAVLRSGRGAAALGGLLDRGAVAVTAEMIGAAEEALAITVQYAKERVQFGEKIGRFQGVKHPLAEHYVEVESFKSLLYYAAWALDENPSAASLAASRAKAYASEAFAKLGIDGVQLHGAIGYTAEYDIQLYLKRSKWARPAFGDADWHYERVAQLGGL
jgi:alkylation response protein AidB-like acyl-CoA dehydrogenase